MSFSTVMKTIVLAYLPAFLSYSFIFLAETNCQDKLKK